MTTQASWSNISAVVLGAGQGRRLGLPKAILKIRPESGTAPSQARTSRPATPLAIMQAENLWKVGIRRIHIVIGCQHKKVAAILQSAIENRNSKIENQMPAQSRDLVVNKNWEQGQFSSVKAGIASARNGDWILLLPVDVLGVKKSTIRRIVSAALSNVGADAVVPSFRGKRGHPALLSPNLCRRIARMDPRKSRLDHLLRAAKTSIVEVADDAVLSNVNTTADFTRQSAFRFH